MWHKRVIKTNDKLHWNAYRHFRQEVKREIRLAEKEHFRSEILKSNQKYQFDLEILNRYISRKYTSLTTVQNTLLLANKFNEFYANVGTMTTLKATKLAEEHNFNIHDTEGLDPCESDHNSWPKAVGCDRVNASSPVIAPIIASLINSFTLVLFLFHGRTQKSLQFLSQGTVTSLQTRGQWAAHLQFTDFLHFNNVIHHLQSGNRKLHSTEAALLHFTDELRNNMDQKKISVIVLLDISKAFDSIRHYLMIRKLRKAGVSESACAWFESYLSQRQQVVKFQNTVSDPLPLTVPQGSIMVPVLFRCMETTSFEFQNIANHSAMWMTPNPSLCSPPANLTTLSLQ